MDSEWVPVIVRVQPPIVVSPIDYLVRAYRNSYLACELPSILDYFRPFTGELEHVVLTHDGKELPWHQPTGLLIDMHKPEFPWVVQLEAKVPILDVGHIRAFWMQQVKEACYIREGNAGTVMKMSTQDSQGLWEAVASHDFEAYRRLLPLRQIRKVPLKLYSPEMSYHLADPKQTLGQLLHSQFPTRFQNTRLAIDEKPVLRGAAVPLQAPLDELYEFHYIDGFLHIFIS